MNDAERLQRTRAHCLRLRKLLAAAMGAAGADEQDGALPAFSTLLRKMADMPPAARGKNRERREPPLLLWKLTHCRTPRVLRLSEAAACFLWSLRVTGRLDPEDDQAPSSDTVAALVLFAAAAPEGSHRRTAETVIRMLTPLDAPRCDAGEDADR
jgi:hypothetical protein